MAEGSGHDVHLIGWQGLTLRVPVLWEPHTLSGSRAKGALQLDDGEAVRLRCTWQELRRAPDLLAEANSYIERLQKDARKKKVDFAVKRDIRFPLPAERAAVCLSWRAEETAYVMLLFCQECRRLCTLYLFGRPGQGLERDARQVFAEFRCHGEGDRERWSVFGLRAELPVGWDLAKSELRAGQVTLQFARGSWELALARVALAESILRRKKFVRWAEEFYGKPLRNFRWEGQRTEYRGHIALGIEGKERLRGPLIRLFRKPRTLRVRAWYCDELDKIYAVWYVGSEPEVFEGLAAGVACHQTQEQYLARAARETEVSAGKPSGGDGG